MSFISLNPNATLAHLEALLNVPFLTEKEFKQVNETRDLLKKVTPTIKFADILDANHQWQLNNKRIKELEAMGIKLMMYGARFHTRDSAFIGEVANACEVYHIIFALVGVNLLVQSVQSLTLPSLPILMMVGSLSVFFHYFKCIAEDSSHYAEYKNLKNENDSKPNPIKSLKR